MGLKLGLQFAGQNVFGSNAYLLVYNFAIFENEESRDVADAKLHSDFTLFVYVHLSNYGAAVKVLGEFVHDGTHHAAGTAPCGPKINQYGLIRIQDYFLEVAFGNLECHANYFDR
jgi:hypothetical protein